MIHTRPARYVSQDRGDRLNPKRSHSRYWHLVLLRERLQQIANSPWLPEGETILDYGCGSRPYEPLFTAKFGRYLGADFPGNERAEIIVGPQGQLSVAEGSIDCVLSSQVLEHVEDPQVYLEEAYRVLKAEGSLILSTHGIWRYHPDPMDCWRWTAEGLRIAVQRAGFDISQMYSVFGLASSALQLWQDATIGTLPRFLQPLYVRCVQAMIGRMERRHLDEFSWNASVYVVWARKKCSPP